MKNKMKQITPPIFALVCTMLMFSCGKETQSSTQGGGIFKIKFTVSPPLPIGLAGTAPYTGHNTFLANIVTLQILGWNGKDATSPLSTLETNEFSVTKGQNVNVFQLQIGNFDNVCRTVKCEGLLNGKTTQVFSRELGAKDYVKSINCKDVQNPGVIFVIP